MNRIPTQRSVLRKIGGALWAELESNVWLPAAIAGVLLIIVNFPN